MMGPAVAMGTFLRVWRSEWAGLSRAQLAIAVSAHLTKRKVVTPRMVLHWEEGHAPSSTEELETLCLVMRRHGVTAWEAQNFRKSVFAACVNRQYPELFPEESLADRQDIEGVAHAMALSPNTLQVASALDELGCALWGRRGWSTHQQQARRQAAALCVLRHVLADIHGRSSRRMLGAKLHGANAETLAQWFGPSGLGGHLTVIAQRSAEVATRKLSASSDAEMLLWAQRLVALGEQRQQRGDVPGGAHDILAGLDCWALSGPPVCDDWRAKLEQAYARQAAAGDPEDASYLAFGLLLSQGVFDEAERHLLLFESWRNKGPFWACLWHGQTGLLRQRQAAFQEAEQELKRALAYATDARDTTLRDCTLKHLARLDRAQHAARHRRTNARKPTRPAAK